MRILCALVGVIPLLAIAAPADGQMTLGLKGGIGLASASIEEARIDEGSVVGMVASVDLDFPMSSVFGLRFGGSFAQKGGSGTIEDTGVRLDIDYIQLSALARVATLGEGGLSVGVVAGPWAAYRLSCDVEAASGGVSTRAACDNEEFSDFDIKMLDFGLALGAGVEFPFCGSLRLGIDALYSYGLVPVDEDETKTRHLTVQTGLAFPVG